jgi:hypothetical protein
LRADEEATENKIRNKTAYCLTSSAIAAASITYFLHKKNMYQAVASATFIKKINKTQKRCSQITFLFHAKSKSQIWKLIQVKWCYIRKIKINCSFRVL